MRFLLIILSLWATALPAQEAWQGVDRIVAVGDLHGDYDQYVRLLKCNDLVNDRLKWTGGKTHFVQLGDVPDRGPDSLEIIRHLMKLEKQARRAGGNVHALIGNHEAMNIEGDLRYVHPGEYSVLVNRRSRRLQETYIDRVFEHMLAEQPELAEIGEETREQLEARFPLGYVEHRRLWEPGQKIARWVAEHNAVIKINRTLFVHGGLNPHTEPRPLADINAQIREILSGPEAFTKNYANSEDGPLWYRGLAMHDAEVELEPLMDMLAWYDADRIVVAHTATKGDIVFRFDGRVIMIDVGISAHYGGHLANLVIDVNGPHGVTSCPK